jgi:hypothetical protein
MALIGGQTYGTMIYMGGSAGTGTATGAPANPAVGTSYCVSGGASYENCSKQVTSLSASFCDTSGCTTALAAYTGGSSTQNGDSGGALVLKSGGKVYPRGIHIARSGSTMYAEKWNLISVHLGVSGVTT